MAKAFEAKIPLSLRAVLVAPCFIVVFLENPAVSRQHGLFLVRLSLATARHVEAWWSVQRVARHAVVSDGVFVAKCMPKSSSRDVCSQSSPP